MLTFPVGAGEVRCPAASSVSATRLAAASNESSLANASAAMDVMYRDNRRQIEEKQVREGRAERGFSRQLVCGARVLYKVRISYSQDTIHRWIRLKGMPSHKVGRLWKFDVNEINKWVKSGKAAE